MIAREQVIDFSETGCGSEFLAGQYFGDRGYRIVERNYRTRRGEIDLVVEKDGELAFVEVRYRKSKAFGTPEETVTRSKRRRLSLAALEFVSRRGDAEGKSLRFDVLAMERRGTGIGMAHVEGAFEPDFGGAAMHWN